MAGLACANVFLAALGGQLHLPLAFGQGSLLLGCAGAVAIGATHALHVVGMRPLGLAQRHAARAAQLVRAAHQAVAYRHTFVKHKALALPAGDLLGHGLQVFEDAAFQVIDLVKTLRFEEGGGFFAANAAGAEHGHLGVARQHPTGL